MKSSYYVEAIWDADASVWISQTDIPGLVIEADTLGAFESLMVDLAPEMLDANHEDRAANVPLVFSARREFEIG